MFGCRRLLKRYQTRIRNPIVDVSDNAFLVIAIGLLVSAASIWVVKVLKTTSAAVPAH
jgi:hypothetical protein